jgi:hypothetical protein
VALRLRPTIASILKSAAAAVIGLTDISNISKIHILEYFEALTRLASESKWYLIPKGKIPCPACGAAGVFNRGSNAEIDPPVKGLSAIGRLGSKTFLRQLLQKPSSIRSLSKMVFGFIL